MAHFPSTHADFAEGRPARENSINDGQATWQGPGIFVKVEFGVSFSPTRTRQLSFGYASRPPMDTRSRPHPPNLVPGIRRYDARGAGAVPQDLDDEASRGARRQRIRSRSALQLRTAALSPVSTLSPDDYRAGDHPSFYAEPVFLPSPLSTRNQRSAQNSQSTYRPSPISQTSHPGPNGNTYSPSSYSSYYSSPQTAHTSASASATSSGISGNDNRLPPFAPIRQSTIDRRPLPLHPSRFRLGSDDLPWSSPTWNPNGESHDGEPSSLALSSPRLRQVEPRWRSMGSPAEIPPSGRDEDLQRTRDLSQLHQAMLCIDSVTLSNDWWEPGGSYDRLGELGGLPRGPRGVGWAVAVPTGGEATEQANNQTSQRGGDEQGTQHYRNQQDRQNHRNHQNQRNQQNHQNQQNQDRNRNNDPFGIEGDLLQPPPPPYSYGQWGSDWEWEESSGYWVRGLRRSSSVL